MTRPMSLIKPAMLLGLFGDHRMFRSEVDVKRRSVPSGEYAAEMIPDAASQFPDYRTAGTAQSYPEGVRRIP